MSNSRVHKSRNLSRKNRSHKRHFGNPHRPHKGARKHTRLEIIYRCILCGALTEELWMFFASDPGSQNGSSEEQTPTKYALCDFCEMRSDRIESVEVEIAAQKTISDGDAL